MHGKLLIVMALVMGLLLISSPVMAAPASSLSVPVTGTGTNSTFAGTLNITKFVSQNGQLAVVGTLTGTLTTLVNGLPTVTSIVQNVTVPVIGGSATCSVLHLELGPIHLSVLGLNVDTNKIVIDITANPSNGLLGQLLCSLAGGLDLNNITNGILAILNQILAQL